MIKGFKDRKWWAIVIVCLLMDSFGAMLYIGRGRLSFAYISATFVLAALPFAASHCGVLTISPEEVWWILPTVLRVICAVHAIKIRNGMDYSIPHRWYSRWYSILALVWVLPIALALSFRTFLFESFYSPAASMAPSVSLGDNFFVSKFAYRMNDKPKRGDVIAFLKKSGVTYLKRVVGLPGDKIQMKDGILYINEKPVVREYLKDETINDDSGASTIYKRYTETLPDGKKHDIYEVSDNERLDNTEEYLVPEHHYFTLGDNRDQSLDSRLIDEVGYIAEDKIIGKAAYFFWNFELKKVIWRPVE